MPGTFSRSATTDRGGTTLTAEIVVLLLRFAVLLAIYLFLCQVVMVVWRDLRRPGAERQTKVEARARLLVVDPGGTDYLPGHVFSLLDRASLGRGTENSVVLADGHVSSRHAVLDYHRDAWWVSDVGSRNGTLLNGEPITAEAQLQEGDLLGLGQVRLRFSQ